MTWLAQNWIWVLFGVACVAMHLFGRGGHGGHGGHIGHVSGQTIPRDATDAHATEAARDRSAAPSAGRDMHRH